MHKHTISFFCRAAMKYPVRTIMTILASLTTTIVSSLISPLIISMLLNNLQEGTITLDSSFPLLIAYSVTQLYGQTIGWRLGLYFAWTMETAAQSDIQKEVFSKLTQQSLTFHSNKFGGALVSQTTKLVGSFERFWDTIIFSVVPVATNIIAATIILGFVFWQYAIFLFAFSILFAIVVFFSSKFLGKRNREESQASTETNAFIADAITNVITIKSHGHEKRELETLIQKSNNWRNKGLSMMRGFLGVSTGYSIITMTLNIVALVGAIWASQNNLISVGIVYLCITYTFSIGERLWAMNNIMRSYNRAIGDAHDMVEILRTDTTVVDKTDQPLIVKTGSIDFKNMCFTHDDNKKRLFDNFSLSIKPGEHIGLVGHSGSGKTTLTNLLLRFSDIESGSIEIDGQDISLVTQESLRKNISYVPQEPMLFHRTLRENIAYGKPNATEEEIVVAIKKANAHDFIMSLPEKLETKVGERGVKLSGGQRQRVAIARTILKNAPILILDEATSALDSESEALIQEALGTLMKDHTSIVVAHRLSTIAKLDRIIVLDNGAIKEQGSHKDLLEQNGTYAKLWAHQSGGFIEE